MTQRHPGRLVTIFGGSGFVGRHVVRELARRGWRIRVGVRRPERANFLQPMGAVGQIQPVKANILDAASVAAALEGADAAMNLVGILAEGGKQTFAALQAEGPGVIAKAAKAEGIERMVQVSAIGADPDSPAAYGRTKAAGEAAVLDALPGSIVLRPSIVFGPEDGFFNRFAAMAKLSPVIPVICGKTRFQPVFVGDVADFAAEALEDTLTPGTTYELGGPDIKTFRELMEMMLDIIERRRMVVDLPVPLARLQARVLSVLPEPPITLDQIALLARDNVVSEAAIAEGRTFAAIGLKPHTMATVLPTYLWMYRPGGQFAMPQG